MPAIQPARLKIRAAELAERTRNPADFCHAYHEFLDYYADRTYRSGMVGQPPPLMRAYNVPQPVLNAVLKELDPIAVSDRDAVLELVDSLWAEPYLEFRLLAASLLGQVSPIPVESVFVRIQNWVKPSTEERLVAALIVSGLERVRLEQSDCYIRQIETWLKSKESFEVRLGLKAIPPLLEWSEFEDFPLLFRLIAQLMRSTPTPLRPEILAVIEAMAFRSPMETAYFLREMVITGGENPNFAWYLRHSLKIFSLDTQEYLREALQLGK